MVQKTASLSPFIDLRSRAEDSLKQARKGQASKAGSKTKKTDALRVLHELEVHQIELEMQNMELHEARNRMEALLEKYTDLYDFAPVGYFSVDESGVILEANLASAALLGMERSRLIKQRLSQLIPAASRAGFQDFLNTVFANAKEQACEVLVTKADGSSFWGSFRATSAMGGREVRKWCRVAFMDITTRKQVIKSQRRVESLTHTNQKLHQEITRRVAVEAALKVSERQQQDLLTEARRMQSQLKQLSHQILHAQEEERKRISRELHDDIAQTLVGINVHLTALSRNAAKKPKSLQQSISKTRRLVEKSVNIVHRFARELRPTVLDDLGLIPALHSFLSDFSKRTGIRTQLTAFPAIEQLTIVKRTTLYRVAYEALNNVANHAQASRVEISMEKKPGSICMSIKDNGKAFLVEQMSPANGGKRLGLVGMRERLEMVGGALVIESVPGKGTEIKAQLPAGKSDRKPKLNGKQI